MVVIMRRVSSRNDAMRVGWAADLCDEVAEAVQDGWVLDVCGEDVRDLVFAGFDGAHDRPVVALGSA